MKKLILALAILCSAVFAQPDDSYFLPRSYFGGAGFSLIATRGDFSERSIKVKDEDGVFETINFPSTKFLLSPEYIVGVNISEFSLAATFQYWSMNGDIRGLPPEKTKQDLKYWRFGVEFTYNFFYPEFFQVGLGLGYSFSTMSITDNATSTRGYADSELMGSAIALVGNVRYYITEHICLSPTLRIYENWYKRAYTKKSGTTDLDSYVWQTFIAISLNILFQF